ncbi:MAG: two-component sensor histidine kinase [Thermoleophilia bacterium]|nr:two-component sensor histidine kinase [Thermoleophilia bacterium]
MRAVYDARVRSASDTDRGTTDRRLLLQFVLGGALVALAIGLGATFLLRGAARAEAERSARRSTELAARGIVQPQLGAELLDGDPSARAALDRSVRALVLDSTTVRVKLWAADGTVVYSDQPRLVGKRFPLDDEELEVLRNGGTVSEITKLDREENRDDRSFGRLLEVYTQVEAPDGTPLLYETYVRDADVSRTGRALWTRLLPTAVGALLLLELVQIPLALRLAGRLRRRRLERERLLQAAVDSGDVERRRIARDLHDGVVQHLAGVGMHLHAASLERSREDPERAGTLEAAAGDVRQAIRELRTLLVDIYPPNLRELGLQRALEDLVSELTARGIEPQLRYEVDGPVDASREQLLYRVAQEAVRNAERHSGAGTLQLEVRSHPDGSVTLRVCDDGAGFDPDAPVGEGHVGLVLLRDLALSAGGRLVVRSSAGHGTDVCLELGPSDG